MLGACVGTVGVAVVGSSVGVSVVGSLLGVSRVGETVVGEPVGSIDGV